MMASVFHQRAQQLNSTNQQEQPAQKKPSVFHQRSQQLSQAQQQPKQKEEGYLKSAARTLLQVPAGVAQAVTYPMDILQMQGIAESTDPFEIERLRQISEERGIPFDEEKYMQAVQHAAEYFPTQGNIEQAVEERTGIPLEPKTRFQKGVRFASTAAKLSPKGATFRGMEKELPRPVLGVGVEAAKEALVEAGVPEPFAEIGAFAVLKRIRGGLREETPPAEPIEPTEIVIPKKPPPAKPKPQQGIEIPVSPKPKPATTAQRPQLTPQKPIQPPARQEPREVKTTPVQEAPVQKIKAPQKTEAPSKEVSEYKPRDKNVAYKEYNKVLDKLNESWRKFEEQGGDVVQATINKNLPAEIEEGTEVARNLAAEILNEEINEIKSIIPKNISESEKSEIIESLGFNKYRPTLDDFDKLKNDLNDFTSRRRMRDKIALKMLPEESRINVDEYEDLRRYYPEAVKKSDRFLDALDAHINKTVPQAEDVPRLEKPQPKMIEQKVEKPKKVSTTKKTPFKQEVKPIEVKTEEKKPEPVKAVESKKPKTEWPSTVYRGYGREKKESIYRGVAEPILGEGKYFAFTEKEAKKYGPHIEKKDIDLKNPLIIRNDDDWRAFTKRAGLDFPNPFDFESSEQMLKNVKKLRVRLEKDGYDGAVIWFDNSKGYDITPAGDIKVLKKVFGEPQVFELTKRIHANVSKGIKKEKPKKINIKMYPTKESDLSVLPDQAGFRYIKMNGEEGYWYFQLTDRELAFAERPVEKGRTWEETDRKQSERHIALKKMVWNRVEDWKNKGKPLNPVIQKGDKDAGVLGDYIKSKDIRRKLEKVLDYPVIIHDDPKYKELNMIAGYGRGHPIVVTSRGINHPKFKDAILEEAIHLWQDIKGRLPIIKPKEYEEIVKSGSYRDIKYEKNAAKFTKWALTRDGNTMLVQTDEMLGTDTRPLLKEYFDMKTKYTSIKKNTTEKRDLKTQLDEKKKEIERVKEENRKVRKELKQQGETYFSKKSLKSQKEYIIDKVDEALENPPNKDTVTIRVPNDGVFDINNHHMSLTSFKDKIMKDWPDKDYKPSRKK